MPGLAAIVPAIGALALLALAPPAQGRMLIVSVAGEDANRIAAWAVPAGARLVAAGPGGISLIVEGEAGALARAALAHGSLVVAAPAGGCGSGSAAR